MTFAYCPTNKLKIMPLNEKVYEYSDKKTNFTCFYVLWYPLYIFLLSIESPRRLI